MERDWWPMALLGIVALVGLLLLALITVGLLDPSAETEPVAIAPEPSTEVSLDSGRVAAGIGAAVLFFGGALWVIKRTDWSLDEP